MTSSIQLQPELWLALYRFSGSRELTCDAVSEALCRYEATKSGEISDPQAWLFRVGKNWLIDQMRKEKCESDFRHKSVRPSRPLSPFTIILNKELRSVVRAALHKLSFDDQVVLITRYGLGWNSKKIASVFCSSIRAVDMRLVRARRRLKGFLIENHPEFLESFRLPETDGEHRLSPQNSVLR